MYLLFLSIADCRVLTIQFKFLFAWCRLQKQLSIYVPGLTGSKEGELFLQAIHGVIIEPVAVTH